MMEKLNHSILKYWSIKDTLLTIAIVENRCAIVNILSVFTITFDQINSSLLNKTTPPPKNNNNN